MTAMNVKYFLLWSFLSSLAFRALKTTKNISDQIIHTGVLNYPIPEEIEECQNS